MILTSSARHPYIVQTLGFSRPDPYQTFLVQDWKDAVNGKFSSDYIDGTYSAFRFRRLLHGDFAKPTGEGMDELRVPVRE